MSRATRHAERQKAQRARNAQALIAEMRSSQTLEPAGTPVDCDGAGGKGCEAVPVQPAAWLLRRESSQAFLCAYCLSLVVAGALAHLEELRRHHLHLY